ncbi:efflux RND transporter periplasmic adaptor subunit [Colwellia sp. D2M02]|uniref:efflux RND transporter periplasmic adaptor subunit n=1 Tax=Colwellia sp. D2M02 TaxID=2841562 RepID=UPI001C0A62F8|nr:efflux RND transporter periplasmic adaptor subunit [Colwellia sp. D2M02]MBU2893429.1 efflux RND transporter periplasmic adaptor subunit [Colwellia sp. D2M02]
MNIKPPAPQSSQSQNIQHKGANGLSIIASPLVGLAVGLAIGILLTLILVILLSDNTTHHSMPDTTENAISVNSTPAKAEPLYWVAPMDANYRRDKPGKSPMGMDLIPYYGNTAQNNAFDEGPGTISISPSVINNLGVRTTEVSLKSLNNEIKTVGYVTYNEDKLIHIHPRVAGWIEKLHIQAIGDTIKQGQPLYDIYSPELVNAQEELLLALDRKNTRLINAAKNRLVALQLPESAITTLKNTRRVQQYVTFYAPQNGVVESLDIREGFYVKPETMMLSIVDLSQVWLKAEVFEKDIVNVATGNTATMHLDYFPGRVWSGTVAHIHPMLTSATRTGIVRLKFDNSDGYLKPNMFAQVTLNVSASEPVLQIPREALIRTGHQDRVVLALGDGYFKSVAVTVGHFDNNHVEILTGLHAGEKIVSSAQFLLDSESSKSSDFKRMDAFSEHAHMTDEYGNNQHSTDEHSTDAHKHGTEQNTSQVSSAMVHGTVTSVMADHRMVTIDREAIEKWNRPAASVDFIVDDAVDIGLFATGAYLMFTFEIHDGDFIIIKAMAMKGNNHGDFHDHGAAHTVEAGLNKVYTK